MRALAPARSQRLPHYMNRQARPSSFPSVFVVAGGIGVVLVWGWMSLLSSPGSRTTALDASVGKAAGNAQPPNLAAAPSSQPGGRFRATKGSPPQAAAIAGAASPESGSPAPQGLVARLSGMGMSDVSLTPEVVDHWHRGFQQLVQQGPAALPAIRDYLMAFTDVSFGPEGLQKLGHGSARTALIAALAQIGGPEAMALTLEMMRLTAEPPEIALLAANLERLAPDQPHWRGEATQAARESLTLAAGKPTTEQDVAPLFEVLNRYGGASTVPDLEQASGNWNYYAAMTLAQLPDGAGVPSLVHMAQEQKGIIPFQMLAQLATENVEARTALLELAGANTIPASAWPHLQPVLQGQRFHFADSVFDESGDTASTDGMNMVHIAKGNQNYYLATDASRLSKKHLDQQTALVDDLVAVVEDPAATQALEGARAALTSARAGVDGAHRLRVSPP